MKYKIFKSIIFAICLLSIPLFGFSQKAKIIKHTNKFVKTQLELNSSDEILKNYIKSGMNASQALQTFSNSLAKYNTIKNESFLYIMGAALSAEDPKDRVLACQSLLKIFGVIDLKIQKKYEETGFVSMKDATRIINAAKFSDILIAINKIEEEDKEQTVKDEARKIFNLLTNIEGNNTDNN
jgi:hypothetical protein